MEISNQTSADSRRQNRFGIESITLPFIGTRDKDHVCFEYLLFDISISGVQFGIPDWVVNREKVRKDEYINFHIPFKITGTLFNLGKVMWAKRNESTLSNVYGAKLESRFSGVSPVFISLENSEISIDLQNFPSIEKLLVKVIKDSYLLKKGVIVYLNHLVPYFSRVTKYPAKDYAMLKEFLLDDVLRNVTKHKCALETLYDNIQNDINSELDIYKFIDLEELREIFESEINLDLFRQTFESEYVDPYLMSIKELEKKLYYNYNTVVMIYMKTLN